MTVAEGLATVRERIASACAAAGREPSSVRLLAASKYQSLDAIRSAYAEGQREFGENYVQELVHKSAALADLADIRWHLIGRLQTNKVKDVLRVGCCVQSVDSLKLCEALATRAAKAGQSVDVFVQVNISDESQKAGVQVHELAQLVAAVRAQPALQLQGLMSLPKPVDDPDALRQAFRQVRELAHGLGIGELSMGMSDDLELAIAEGSTVVRVGTALFGERTAQ